MSVFESLLLLVTFLNLFSGLYVLSRNPRDWNSRLFCISSFLVSLWTGTNYLSGVFATPATLEATYATGALVIGSVFIWILYVARGVVPRSALVVIVLVSSLFAVLSFVPQFLVAHYEAIYTGGVFVGTPSWGLWIYTILFCGSGVYMLRTLYFAILRESDIHRKNQLRAVWGGALVTFVLSGLTSFILPILSIFSFGGLDSVGVVIFELAGGYTIVNDHFFNMHVLRTDLLIAALWIAILWNVFLSDSPSDFAVSSILLVVGSVVSFVLRHGVLEEIRQRKQLTELNATKDEFLSFASHQLRSPLTVIAGYASMIQSGETGGVSPRQKEIIGNMFDATINLSRLVEDFLTVSRIEQGGMKYTSDPFDIHSLLHDIVRDMQVPARAKSLQLRYHTPDTLPCMLVGDEDKLREVFVNVVDNALKYTSEGWVAVTLSRTEDAVVVEIQDTGIGIAPEMQEVIFHKFKRARTDRAVAMGSGLGLYLAKQIVEGHKGSITVVSPGVSQGATFTITLPSRE